MGFPDMGSGVPASPACGVCVSRLIRCARGSGGCSDLLRRRLRLGGGLLGRGCGGIRLVRSLKKFIFRYQYLVGMYSVSAGKIVSDAFSYSEGVWG